MQDEEDWEDDFGNSDVFVDDIGDIDGGVFGGSEEDIDEEDIFEELNKCLGIDLLEDIVFDQDYDGFVSYVFVVGE